MLSASARNNNSGLGEHQELPVPHTNRFLPVMMYTIYNSVHLKDNQIATYPFQKQNKEHILKQ